MNENTSVSLPDSRDSFVRRICVPGIVVRRCGDDIRSARENQRRGGKRGVAVVVGAIRDFACDDRQVVLGIVGKIILALRPLAHVAPVTGAHDRAPRDLAAAVSAIVLRAVCLPVVTQSEVVPGFVRGRLGDVRLTVAELVVIDPCGTVVGVVAAGEDVHIGDPARARRRVVRAVGVGVSRDQHMRGARIEYGGPFGGHVDVERGEILRDAQPDALDRKLFAVAEC